MFDDKIRRFEEFRHRRGSQNFFWLSLTMRESLETSDLSLIELCLLFLFKSRVLS